MNMQTVAFMNLGMLHTNAVVFDKVVLNLKRRHQEHLRYMKHNDLQFPYASHILSNVHECGRVDNIMSLLKQMNIQRPTNEFFWTILYSVTLL